MKGRGGGELQLFKLHHHYLGQQLNYYNFVDLRGALHSLLIQHFKTSSMTGYLLGMITLEHHSEANSTSQCNCLTTTLQHTPLLKPHRILNIILGNKGVCSSAQLTEKLCASLLGSQGSALINRRRDNKVMLWSCIRKSHLLFCGKRVVVPLMQWLSHTAKGDCSLQPCGCHHRAVGDGDVTRYTSTAHGSTLRQSSLMHWDMNHKKDGARTNKQI